jgi:large subunit ribosomal protein L11
MAKKELKAKVKLQCPAGEATPAPPVGPALGQHGVNIGEFVRRFNEATAKDRGTVIPVILSVYTDRSFDFILKSPPASVMLRQAAKVEKGSATPNTAKVGKVTREQVQSIAKRKMADLNANSMEAAERVIAGTARSMGLDVVD